MEASDIVQESAYMCKLPELPPGNSKGLLHFMQCKGSTKTYVIQDKVCNLHVSQENISKTILHLKKLLIG